METQTPPRGSQVRQSFLLLLCLVVAIDAHAGEIDFQRDIRPILNTCVHCHGADEGTREADLRLDRADGAQAVIAATADESELIRRVTSADPDEVMPPPDAGESLTAEQIGLLRKWIDAGAEWKQHWSFERPRKSTSTHADHTWVRQPFDAFVLEQLVENNLQPSPPANRNTLIRRLSMDLTGLPPRWEDVVAFRDNKDPQALERVVDRLLDSKHFGERMANDWLDAARYADTDGYQGDGTRTNWPWRDWVVRAFNDNMPFDQFTIEQFAGDLLPEATADQILATCFHRNHMTNGEGGRDPEESRIDYVIDRVNTMGTVWLGLTVGCTQCHSHKYDPISHAEYYSLNAFFNSIDEDGKAGGGAKPFYEYASDDQAAVVKAGLADSQTWKSAMQTKLANVESRALERFPEWLAEQKTLIEAAGQGGSTFRSWQRPQLQSLASTHGAKLVQADNGEVLVSGENARHDDYRIGVRPSLRRITGMRLTVLPDLKSGKLSADDSGHFIVTNMKINVARRGSKQVRELSVATGVADYEKEKTGRSYGPVKTLLDDDPRSGWTSLGADPTEARVAVFGFETPQELAADEYLALEFRHRSLMGHVSMRRFTLEFTEEVGPTLETWEATPLEKLAENGFEDLAESDQQDLREQFLVDRADVMAVRDALARAKSRVKEYEKAAKPVKVMVLKDRDELRTTHVLLRGEWDKKGSAVTRRGPEILPAIRNEGADTPPSRLDLARWLVSAENPLTARVVVNRVWQMLFGYGLVRTPEDFGTQGELPTHPRVLDSLAVEFVESGWDMKRLIRTIVLSSTYQQSSDVSPELLERDPQNRLLARNTRFRMPSWMIRDAALQSSGLLDARLGGPPVYPRQPPGAWADATMGRFHYQSSVGNDLYRRSVYSFWRRSVAPTAFFDASKRRNCVVRQVRTNTPLHALNLLNDKTYVEAARALAVRAITRHDDDRSRIDFMFGSVVSRSASEREVDILIAQLQAVAAEFETNAGAAKQLSATGQLELPDGIAVDELAAWTTVAGAILNLDEAITRE